jgi:hypothetical protein
LFDYSKLRFEAKQTETNSQMARVSGANGGEMRNFGQNETNEHKKALFVKTVLIKSVLTVTLVTRVTVKTEIWLVKRNKPRAAGGPFFVSFRSGETNQGRRNPPRLFRETKPELAPSRGSVRFRETKRNETNRAK